MLQQTILRVILPAVVSVGALAIPSGANASSSGCTAAPLGMSCINVHGSGLHVDRVDAVRDKASYDFICGYSARVIFHKPDGKTDVRDSGVVHNGACSVGRAWITFDINADYPDGTRVCTAFYENGEQQGGRPCEKVHS
jgi:hypothetical protein